MKLYCPLELVFILRIESWMVRSQYFVSFQCCCSFSLFLETSAWCSWRTKGTLFCSSARVIQTPSRWWWYPSSKHRSKEDKNNGDKAGGSWTTTFPHIECLSSRLKPRWVWIYFNNGGCSLHTFGWLSAKFYNLAPNRPWGREGTTVDLMRTFFFSFYRVTLG